MSAMVTHNDGAPKSCPKGINPYSAVAVARAGRATVEPYNIWNFKYANIVGVTYISKHSCIYHKESFQDSSAFPPWILKENAGSTGFIGRSPCCSVAMHCGGLFGLYRPEK